MDRCKIGPAENRPMHDGIIDRTGAERAPLPRALPVLQPLTCFVTNLQRRPDRHKYVVDTYPTASMRVEVVAGFDGHNIQSNTLPLRQLCDEFCSSMRSAEGRTSHLRLNPLKPGELGCWVSLLNLLRRIVQQDLPEAGIFEDDCIFCDGFDDKLNELRQEYMVEDYDVLYLGGKMVPRYENPLNIRLNKYVHVKKDPSPYGTFAMIISNKGARRILDDAFNSFSGNLGCDYFIDVFVPTLHLVSPMLVHSVSTIQPGDLFRTDVQ